MRAEDPEGVERGQVAIEWGSAAARAGQCVLVDVRVRPDDYAITSS